MKQDFLKDISPLLCFLGKTGHFEPLKGNPPVIPQLSTNLVIKRFFRRQQQNVHGCKYISYWTCIPWNSDSREQKVWQLSLKSINQPTHPWLNQDLRETLSTLRYAVQATTIQGDTQGGDRDPRNNLIYKLKQELILLRRATTTALSDRAQEASISWGVQVKLHPLFLKETLVIDKFVQYDKEKLSENLIP